MAGAGRVNRVVMVTRNGLTDYGRGPVPCLCRSSGAATLGG